MIFAAMVRSYGEVAGGPQQGSLAGQCLQDGRGLPSCSVLCFLEVSAVAKLIRRGGLKSDKRMRSDKSLLP